MSLIDVVMQNVNLSEGKPALLKIIIEIYFNPSISVKEMSRKVFLPVPVVSAIKNELKKQGFVQAENGMKLTNLGLDFVLNTLQYNHLDIELYKTLKSLSLTNTDSFDDFINKYLTDELLLLQQIFENRPTVDVTIDQSKCTPATSLKRALLCFLNDSLIGKSILCVGDDDLVSVSLGILLRKLFKGNQKEKSNITVIDIDERFLAYIKNTALQYELPIECINHDFRLPLNEKFLQQYDCAFTDPPYTLSGLELFLERAVSSLAKEPTLPIFLSFAHKTPDFVLDMQKLFNDMGLVICNIYYGFNFYDGAQILGGTSDMTVLNTTTKTAQPSQLEYNKPIYTGEMKQTVRYYECAKCKTKIRVGSKEKYITIEALKQSKCPNNCDSDKFNLLKTENTKTEREQLNV